MAYVWIFIACYVVVFIIINIRMSAQTSMAKAQVRNFGGSDEQFVAHMRTEVPLSKELLVRVWAPLVYCLTPAIIVSIVYFIFS